MIPLKDWFFVINPVAGSGKGKKTWDKIHTNFGQQIPTDQYFITKNSKSIRAEIPVRLEKGFRNICVVGGDGTLHELLNTIYLSSLALQEFTISQIPVGTGNDWIKSYNTESTDPLEMVRNMQRGKLKSQNLGLIQFGEDNNTNSHVFINMTGIGFSGEVVKNIVEHNWMKKSGAIGYTISLLYSLFGFEDKAISIDTKNHKEELELFHLSIGLGKYAGGGMKFCPEADPSKNSFYVSRVAKISRHKVVRNILGLFNGSYIQLPEVRTAQTSLLLLRSEHPIPVESDGEYLGEHQLIKVQILNEVLNILLF